MRTIRISLARHILIVASFSAALALPSSCRSGESTSPGSTPSAETNASLTGSGDAALAGAAGGPNGMVWDPGAEAPVPNIRLRLVRTDTGQVLDETRSGGDGIYRLKAPDPSEVADGTELGVEILLPPDHVFAFGYGTPTPFPAGTTGSLEHHVMLVGP